MENIVRRYETLKFPDNFMDAGGKTLKVVYDTLKEFVYFTRHWQESTGLLEKWSQYVKARDSLDKDNVCREPCRGDGGVPVVELPMAEPGAGGDVCE